MPRTDPPRATNLTAERFFADTVCSLAGTIESVVGLTDASAFVAQVGSDIGQKISGEYRAAHGGTLPRDPRAIADILADLKHRIGGEFRVVSADKDKLVLTASRCPFAERVEGKPSLCMMTTNVFGRVVANANGYARVDIDEAIALGHGRCHVTVHLRRPDDREQGNDFFAR